MPNLLDEAFWREKFLVSHNHVTKIFHLMEDLGRPVSVRDIGEPIVLRLLEQEYEFGGARVYSPEQSYDVGESVVILGKCLTSAPLGHIEVIA